MESGQPTDVPNLATYINFSCAGFYCLADIARARISSLQLPKFWEKFSINALFILQTPAGGVYYWSSAMLGSIYYFTLGAYGPSNFIYPVLMLYFTTGCPTFGSRYPRKSCKSPTLFLCFRSFILSATCGRCTTSRRSFTSAKWRHFGGLTILLLLHCIRHIFVMASICLIDRQVSNCQLPLNSSATTTTLLHSQLIKGGVVSRWTSPAQLFYFISLTCSYIST